MLICCALEPSQPHPLVRVKPRQAGLPASYGKVRRGKGGALLWSGPAAAKANKTDRFHAYVIPLLGVASFGA